MRTIVYYDAYNRGIKRINKLNIPLDKLNTIITTLATDTTSKCCHMHPLHTTSRAKSGLSGLHEVHITGELLLVYRKVDNNLELVDICKNHKDLKKRY